MDKIQELRAILDKKAAERKKKRIAALQADYLARINSRLRKRQDDNGDQWITTNNGAHILLSKSGEVKAGMGGKFNGQNISDVSGVKESTAPRVSKKPVDSVESGKSNIITRSPIEVNTAIHEIMDNPDKYDEPILGLAENEQERMTNLLSGAFWGSEGNLSREGHKSVVADPLTEISKLFGKELTPAEEEFYDDVVFSIATSNMNLRWAQQGKRDMGIDYLVTANAVEEIIHLSPKWGGGELYRGMVGEQYDINELYKSFQNNTPINMMGMSSWSDDYDIEDSYATSPKGKAGVSIMYTLPKTNKGASVNVYNGTKEVVVSGTADFMVEGISQDNTGRYNVSLKEI